MVGYGPEDSHFVVELTYNYNISSYKLGNDYQVRNIPEREYKHSIIRSAVRASPSRVERVLRELGPTDGQ